jgi:Ca-activated chloride channel family protein
VAVEETVVTIGGEPTRVTVPVEMPDGVSHEGVFGDKSSVMPQGAASPAFPMLAPSAQASDKRFEGQRLSTMAVFARTKARVSSANVVPGGQAGVPAEMQLDETARKSSHLPSPDALPKEEREVSSRPEGESDSRALAIRTKLDPDLRALLDLKEPVVAYTYGKASVKGGAILVQVWLAKRTDEILKTLKEKGLDISYSATAGNMVIGIIRIEKLADLAEIKEVLRILPVSVG